MPIAFTAQSQNAVAKAVTKGDFPEDMDFGVWGIAKNTDVTEPPYFLWTNGLERITNQNGTYKPAQEGHDAYWLRGYNYQFLAIAPYTGLETSVTVLESTASQYKLTFEYDLASKYRDSDYDFSLLAAAATQTGEEGQNKKSQDLIFWNLFARIKINVTFQNTLGKVTKMRLTNVDTDADYTVSLDNINNDADKPLSVVVVSDLNDSTDPETVSFDGMADGGNIIHIVPQSISDFELYLDFEIGEVSTENFKIDLSNAISANNYYDRNNWYNWNITISPKIVTFDVSVTPWVDAEDEFEFPIE